MYWWSSLASNPSHTLFLLILLLLPVQLGKHFWPAFATVSGLRIDFLAPTLYFTDILIILFCAFSLKEFPWRFFRSPLFGMIIFFALVNLIFSIEPLNTIIGIIRFSEYGLFSYLSAHLLSKKGMLRKSLRVLLLAAIWISALAFVQFFLQKSVGGWLYFLGERSFSAQTPGIANASLSGSLVLRPYATFPHPNVLGGFLTAVITVAIYWGLHPYLQKKVINKTALFILGAVFLSLMALLLSMSRSAIVAFFLVLIFYVLRMKTLRIHILTGGIILLLVSALVLILFGLSPRFLELKMTDESVISRFTQINQAMSIIDSYPLFGVGLQNYLIQLGKIESRYQILQPVHNVFFLVWSEMGIVGVLSMVIFLVRLFKRIKDSPSLVREGKFALFFLIIFLGMFDHYLYTLHQGRILLSLLIAFMLSRFSLKG
ncbi:MAG: hypothetical protein KatS3mg089_1001 [Patescibacteria group bacterium]|nr:MAG: hypothetical protein KatS3mg089_1001 [Patescibacteria group bacterium]